MDTVDYIKLRKFGTHLGKEVRTPHGVMVLDGVSSIAVTCITTDPEQGIRISYPLTTDIALINGIDTLESDLIKLIEEKIEMPFNDFLQRSNYKKREYSELRMIHIVFRNIIMGYNTLVAAELYQKKHCTTLHSRKCIRNWYPADKEFVKKYKDIFDFMNILDPNWVSKLNQLIHG